MSSDADGFDVIVVGAGLMGSAAARHLAQMGHRTALIGPAEPRDMAAHTGVFASHYDQARITRRLDTNADWSRLACRSIDRYPEIARLGGQEFHRPVGCLMAGSDSGPGAGFLHLARTVARGSDIAFDDLGELALRSRFPVLSFPERIAGVFEADGAGWIDPRRLVTAQIAAATGRGATLIRSEARATEETATGVRIVCADGTVVAGGKVVVSCGAFSKADGLLPGPPALTVYARTVAYLEVDEVEAQRLRGMPAILYRPPGASDGPYILPPVRYPDGRIYIKIGGDPDDIILDTTHAMKAWFRTEGRPEVVSYLADLLRTLMPDLAVLSVKGGSCVTAFTPSGLPLIYPQTPRIVVLTGGNGAAAKSSDEIGRLGAVVAAGGDLSDEPYDTDFRP